MPSCYGCRYGYPKPLTRDPSRDPMTGRWNLSRYRERDRKVVGYHPEIMLAWQGHMDFQICDSQQTAAYVAKYITKGEPLLRGVKKFTSQVNQYFQTRLVSAPEVCTLFQGHSIFRQSRPAMFVNTSPERWRVPNEQGGLKPGKIELYCARCAETWETIALQTQTS